MAKDPAFLFYTSDFLTGTMFMDNEEAGKYIRILCLLHQHGGSLPREKIEKAVGRLPDVILEKLQTDDKGNLYNERLSTESKKRSDFCESRRQNIQKRYTSATSVEHTNLRMENEDEDVNEDINIVKYRVWEKDVLEIWNLFCMKYPVLPKVRSITKKRRTHLKRRFMEKDFVNNWRKALEAIPGCPFLMGKNERGWTIDFDFLIRNDENYQKILEGKYTDKKGGAKSEAVKALENKGII